MDTPLNRLKINTIFKVVTFYKEKHIIVFCTCKSILHKIFYSLFTEGICSVSSFFFGFCSIQERERIKAGEGMFLFFNSCYDVSYNRNLFCRLSTTLIAINGFKKSMTSHLLISNKENCRCFLTDVKQ